VDIRHVSAFSCPIFLFTKFFFGGGGCGVVTNIGYYYCLSLEIPVVCEVVFITNPSIDAEGLLLRRIVSLTLQYIYMYAVIL
jgi:hypothetical protein